LRFDFTQIIASNVNADSAPQTILLTLLPKAAAKTDKNKGKIMIST
jgi:hypothetical protein